MDRLRRKRSQVTYSDVALACRVRRVVFNEGEDNSVVCIYINDGEQDGR